MILLMSLSALLFLGVLIFIFSSTFFVKVNWYYLHTFKIKIFNDYVFNQAVYKSIDLDVPIFIIDHNIMNMDEKVENEKTLGRYFYSSNYNKNKLPLNYMFKGVLSPNSYDRKEFLPRIELSTLLDSSWFYCPWATLLHEIGHHLCEIRGIDNNEENANAYVLEFFEKELPPFFQFIFLMELESRCNKNIKFTLLKKIKYYIQIKRFKKKLEKDGVERMWT